MKNRLFYVCCTILNISTVFAADNIIKIPKNTMKHCALWTKNNDEFKDCCFKRAFSNQNTHQDNPVIDNNFTSTDTYTSHGYGAYSSEYNKNDAISAAPPFNFTYTYTKKQCSQIGHTNSDGWCVCNNGGDFSSGHCWCSMGAWQKNGQCICQAGTTKYEFYTGPSNSIKTFNCRNDDYINPYRFSNSQDYTYAERNKYHDPDFVDWTDPLSVFWFHYDKSGEEVGMTFEEAFKQQNTRNLNSTNKHPIKKWKVFGIVASNGSQQFNLDIVGDAKCITPDENLDADGGSECVCTVLSVSQGKIQEKWVYNPYAHFYWIFGQKDTSGPAVCDRICAEKCAIAFAQDEYNVRYSLMKHWLP